MESDEHRPTVQQRLVLFLEDNIEIVKPAGYGIASVALLVALRRTRPFLKLKNPSDIPTRFLRERTPLKGTVVSIEPSCGTLLMVDHKPLVPLPRFTSPKYLPVKIFKVNVTSNGISWLETVVSGKEITFVPVAVQKGSLDCIVTLEGKEEGRLQVGKELVKLGFGTVQKVSETSSKDKELQKYGKDLARAEKWAEHRRNGYWHFVKRPTLLWKLQRALIASINSLLPSKLTRMFNV